jgi:hypothetical protein
MEQTTNRSYFKNTQKMKKLLLFLLPILLLATLTYAELCEENEKRDCGYSNKGECRLGTQLCTKFGQWSICLGSKGPIDEICGNEKDDDCDGFTDEQCECDKGEKRTCGATNKGICEYGEEKCINGTWSGNCEGEIKAKATEICNNKLDDDCDNVVDEGCAKPKQNDSQQPQSTCFNKIKDGTETGIDCGGKCKTCATCTDGILNQGETRTKSDLGNGTISDCGGTNCPACPTCFDGKLNQGEIKVDCGGPCKSCQLQQQDKDTDKDGLTDKIELQRGTNPNKLDTDGDGLNDKVDRYPLCPNNFCDENYGETAETCPEDCEVESEGAVGFILIIILILLFCVGGYFYYQFKKGTSKINVKLTKEKGSQRKITFDKTAYRTTANTSTRRTAVEKQLEKSLEKADKYFKK